MFSPHTMASCLPWTLITHAAAAAAAAAVARVVQGTVALLRQLARMAKVCPAQNHVRHPLRKSRHQPIRLAFLSICIFHPGWNLSRIGRDVNCTDCWLGASIIFIDFVVSAAGFMDLNQGAGLMALMDFNFLIC